MTRAIHGFNWALRRRETTKVVPAKQQLFVGAFIVLLVVSAFSVIYLKDLSRRMFIHYQNLQQVQQQDEIEWSKLLLEQGAWSTQARVQDIAANDLNMVMPAMKDVVIIETKHAILPSE
jgi:cell division protein FtsL